MEAMTVSKRWLRLDEAAAYLGMSKWTLYRKKEIAYSRDGRLIIYDIRDLDSWRESHKVRSKEQVEKIANNFKYKFRTL